VSIRLGILNLLERLAAQRNLALLYITHDIASARYFAESAYVMYAGGLVEGGPAEEVTQHAAHPYTQLLISAAPDPTRSRDEATRVRAVGGPPSLSDPPPGCRFHPRCPFVMDKCRTTPPPVFRIDAGHWARCWLHESTDGSTPLGPSALQRSQPITQTTTTTAETGLPPGTAATPSQLSPN
jgi:peptide/nickel transport system ATP-binding protein